MGGAEISIYATLHRAFADLPRCAVVGVAIVRPCLVVPALTLPDPIKLQTSAAWWGGVLFWFVSKLYVAYNVTLSSAVFPMYLYPMMMENSHPLIVTLLPDF